MILESIVTTIDDRGQVNVAPMGPRVQAADLLRENATGANLVLRPFQSSNTYRNLVANGTAVVHVTDNAELFARAAVDAIAPDQVAQLVMRLDETAWWRLIDCHRWLAVKVLSTSGTAPRIDMHCRVERSGIVRPFFGFNRARHAIIEAAILATRTDFLPAQQIRDELKRLEPLIDKTGGPAEHSAFDFLRETIHDRTASR